MKPKYLACASALALAMVTAAATGAQAQPGRQYAAAQQQQRQQRPGQPGTTPGQPPAAATVKTGTFVGRVLRLQNGRYALITGKNGAGYAGHFLSGTGFKKYEGKQVQVKGNLNLSTNTVAVTSIHAA